jgi:hypothetical protein
LELSITSEYSDKSFLGGQAVFQMSLEQSGNSVKLWFSMGYSDGRGAAPEAGGIGKVTNKGTVEFKFDDTSKNLGTGTITRAGDDLIVSLKTTRVADPRCLEFYRQNIRLKPAGKK